MADNENRSTVEEEMPNIQIGEFYEDCRYHPMLCLGKDGEDLTGLDLIDGTEGWGCSERHCGVIRLTIQEAALRKSAWPQWLDAYKQIAAMHRERFPDSEES